ncbi:TauD/TfdA family dioxygenase [Streptomyces sp. NPDC059209]|uniref:TauD/TfdA family dioxygenase n=1 Tax=Streptomyces sp. NPDC059209 TaxID=3346769 RepID=UPI0036B22E1A
MMPESTFALTHEESTGLRGLATRLSETSPALVDELSWLAACRSASCRLPTRLRERLRTFRHDPGPDGVLLLRNLPGADDIPPTPVESDSVERAATLSASVISAVSMELGELIAFRNEKSGALVQNVVPVPGQEAQQSNAGSTVLALHTENAFHPRRPDYVTLLCVRSDHESTAGLRTASVRRAVEGLDGRTREVLRQPRFLTDPPPSFGQPEDATKPHPILTGDLDDPDVRVDFHATRPVDDEAERAARVLERCLDTVAESVRLVAGDLAVLDNRVALHGRTAFVPRYDGGDRWLHRTFIHLNHRRSRVLRAPLGHVLD